jgi:hypothetical protein
MKKALTVALFGALAIFFVPQVASGHETAGTNDNGCATATQGSPHQPSQDPPGEGRSHYDKEHHDGDAVLN